VKFVGHLIYQRSGQKHLRGLLKLVGVVAFEQVSVAAFCKQIAFELERRISLAPLGLVDQRIEPSTNLLVKLGLNDARRDFYDELEKRDLTPTKDDGVRKFRGIALASSG
jgi:hypothetical protein